MHHFTLDDFSSFSQRERELINEILKSDKMLEQPEVEMKPREESLERILAYNKALSVRRTKNNHLIQQVLN
jgi:hypothetical protein